MAYRVLPLVLFLAVASCGGDSGTVTIHSDIDDPRNPWVGLITGPSGRGVAWGQIGEKAPCATYTTPATVTEGGRHA
jgi:hypothetical protein